MAELSVTSKLQKLSNKLGLLILVILLIAFIALGALYISRYTHQVNTSVKQKFALPAYLMSKGMLDYQTVQDEKTMESMVGEEIDRCMIIGANGKIFYALNQQYQDKTFNDIPFLSSFQELTTEVSDNIFITQKEDGESFLIVLSPLKLDDGKFLGYLFIKSSMERVIAKKRGVVFLFGIGSLLSIIITLFLILKLFNKWFTGKIAKIVVRISDLAKGKQVDQLPVLEKDEIGLIKESINDLIEGTKGRVVFADEIAGGNFDAEYEALSDGDLVGKSLLNMRENLKHAQELEIERKKETEIQNWVTKGLANFADILRQDNDNIEKLSYNFIIELINYMGANQGALFVLNDSIEDDHYYESAASVAYDREKTIETKFKVGESLVGRAAYEKQTIYMTDVPQEYVKITSGLGKANPNCILLVPLVADKEVEGVIELVSFINYQPYQIEFVEKLAVSLASTLVNVKINERTGRLLAESQKQREELMAQEEEVRQNLEEMTAIKEEAARQQEEMNVLWKAVKAENCVAIYEPSGLVSETNSQFVETFSFAITDRSNIDIKEVLKSGFENEKAYEEFCRNIDIGRSQRISINIVKDGVSMKFIQSHVPMTNSAGAIDKFMSIGMLVR